jgi:hypothetical protein
MIYKKKIIPLLYLSLLPVISFAQSVERFRNTKEIFSSILDIIRILIPIAFGLAIVLFFWGIVKFLWSEGSGKDEGKRIMVWGVLAIFVMSSIWGLVRFVRGTLGIDPNATNMNIPTINGSGGSGSTSGCAGEPGTIDCL